MHHDSNHPKHPKYSERRRDHKRKHRRQLRRSQKSFDNLGDRLAQAADAQAYLEIFGIHWQQCDNRSASEKKAEYTSVRICRLTILRAALNNHRTQEPDMEQ